MMTKPPINEHLNNQLDLTNQNDVDDRITGLALELVRISRQLGTEPANVELTSYSNVDSRIGLCSTLLQQIDASTVDLRQRLGRVESSNHELSLQLQARSNESRTDALTGVANRRSFDREFTDRCETAQHSQCPLVLCFTDIDHFKSINDRFGHHVGDAVLKGVAQLLSKHAPKGTFLARYGGEEFAMVLMGLSIDDSISVAEQLRVMICETVFRFEGQNLTLTISSGLAILHAHEHCENLLQRADAAMYAAKQAGRNRTFWENRGQIHATTSSHSIFGLERTINSENARPIFDLSTGPSDRSTSIESAVAMNSLRTNRPLRANWCDGAVLFSNVRQRLAEWRGGGAPFCVMALEIDDAQQIAQRHGTMALHFMIRSQALHLDTTLRDMDIVSRLTASRMLVVFPNTTLAALSPILKRLRDTMDRFVFPTSKQSVDYSISVGVTESIRDDDPQRLIGRAEEALFFSQNRGRAKFSAQDHSKTWNVELD